MACSRQYPVLLDHTFLQRQDPARQLIGKVVLELADNTPGGTISRDLVLGRPARLDDLRDDPQQTLPQHLGHFTADEEEHSALRGLARSC